MGWLEAEAGAQPTGLAGVSCILIHMESFLISRYTRTWEGWNRESGISVQGYKTFGD